MRQQVLTLGQLASELSLEYRGDPNTKIFGIASLLSARKGYISFLDNPKYRRYLTNTQAEVVILAPSELPLCPTAVLIAEHPYYVYAKVAEYFQISTKTQMPLVHPSVVQGEGCEIHPTVSIGPHVVLGDGVHLDEHVVLSAGCVLGNGVKLGAKTFLHANVTIYNDVQIGSCVIIHSGVVIGSDGFGVAKFKGYWHKVPQLGRVIIEDDVEIGANTSIDRGALDDTIIKANVKIDNQVQIGHNVVVGEHTAIAGCVGIAGSTVIGKHCLIGGGVGIAGHLRIADNVALTAMTGVAKSILKPGIYSGIPAQSDKAWKRFVAYSHKLDTINTKIKILEQKLRRFLSISEIDD